jgi:hypothetical protein
MAQHLELKSGKLKNWIKQLLDDFFNNYGDLKKINKEDYYSKYLFKNIKIIEEREDEHKWVNIDRFCLFVPRNELNETLRKWLDNNVWGYSPRDYSFEMVVSNERGSMRFKKSYWIVA